MAGPPSDLRQTGQGERLPHGAPFSPETEDTKPDPRQYIRIIDVAADGVTLTFHKVEPGYADGFRVDEDGNLWSSAADGVHCISPQGKLLGKIHVPARVANVTFGGLSKNRPFIGGSQTLYAFFLNCRGVQTP
jgi:gluconolactonase